MTTSQAPAQCILRGQEGRYTSACWGGFLRTHWVILITIWLSPRFKWRTILMWGMSPKKQSNEHPVEEAGDLMETFIVRIQQHWVLASHQPFLWRRPTLWHTETDRPQKHPVFFGVISWRAQDRDKNHQRGRESKRWVSRNWVLIYNREGIWVANFFTFCSLKLDRCSVLM